ncbi:MAG: hypothetical protein DPW09_41115 [Anaerolineae bacterium]|nr:hypothetical protein [Anaerolineae bacterium]
MRYVRVIHPAHPLSGQIVKVLRAASDPVGAERHWLIEGPDGQRLLLPQAWADPVSDPDSPASEPGGAVESGVWLDLAGLLKLAAVVQYLQTKLSQEVTVHEAVRPDRRSTGVDEAVGAGERPTAALVGAATGPPTGVVEPFGQLTAAPLAPPLAPVAGGAP